MYKIMTAALLALGACGSSVQTKPGMTQNDVSADNSAQDKIRVAVDSVFTIQLKCSAGMGYSWQLPDSSFARSVQYLRQDFKNLTPDKDGGDGMQTFYFKAVQKGAEKIKLIYVQPFKKPWSADAPAKTFSVDIY